MQNRKKILFTFLFILLISILLSVLTTSETVWSNEFQLTTDPEVDWKPCGTHFLQATNGTIWVVWASNRTGNDEIFYKNSSDGGSIWSNDTQLTNYTESDDSPSIMQAANGSIWVVWTREIMEPYQWDLYYTTSNDGGATWSNDTWLTNDTNFDMAPSITQTANGTIWVVWQSDRIWVPNPPGEDIPQDDLYYKISSDDGATWSNDTQLTTDLRDDVGPSIIQTSNGKIWVTWSSDRHDGFEIFYKTYNGTTWSNEFQLTEHVSNDWGPSITQCNGTIWIVWHSRRDGNYDIYYTTSDDDGANWSYERRITTDTGVDVTPSITQIADSEIWIFFASDRAGNYDIWYKTAIQGVSPSADVDRDGVVDAFDFIKFIGSYGLSIEDEGYNPNADYDGDGDVDDDDFTLFYLYYYDGIP